MATTPLPAAGARSGSAGAAAPASVSASTASQSLLTVIRDLYVTEELPPGQSSAEPSRPATALSEAGVGRPATGQTDAGLGDGPAESDGEGEEGRGLAETDLEASRAAVAALAARNDDAQAARRSELGEYMSTLQVCRMWDGAGGSSCAA